VKSAHSSFDPNAPCKRRLEHRLAPVALLLLLGCIASPQHIAHRTAQSSGVAVSHPLGDREEPFEQSGTTQLIKHSEAVDDRLVDTEVLNAIKSTDTLPPLPDANSSTQLSDVAGPSTLLQRISPIVPPLTLASVEGSPYSDSPGGSLQSPAPPAQSNLSSSSANIARSPSISTLRSSGGSISPILRNRINDTSTSDDDAQYDYPDIHSDPGKRYREQYGVESDYDPFLFPWLTNLIFEDRWLLAEKDPDQALKNQLRRRMKIDIRDPDPDTANFPNGAYTLPKGRLYIETSPVGLYSGSRSGSQPRIYQWEYLIRYGLTDNLEFRVFSNGLSEQGGNGQQREFVGYQPLAFDFKANFWEENTKYHIPAMGIEVYLQTQVLGSSAFNSGTQPSINLLFDQSLPLDIGFEYNFGYTGVQNSDGQLAYQFSYQWSFQREVVKDFDVFIHGFYNAAALPRLNPFQSASLATIPNVSVVGGGGIWTVNNRIAVFGSCNMGVTPDSPRIFTLLGFAVAL
jgi:hypothetical protein